MSSRTFSFCRIDFSSTLLLYPAVFVSHGAVAPLLAMLLFPHLAVQTTVKRRYAFGVEAAGLIQEVNGVISAQFGLRQIWRRGMKESFAGILGALGLAFATPAVAAEQNAHAPTEKIVGEAVTVIEFDVNREGTVTKCATFQSSGVKQLDDNACQNIQKVKFPPWKGKEGTESNRNGMKTRIVWRITE